MRPERNETEPRPSQGGRRLHPWDSLMATVAFFLVVSMLQGGCAGSPSTMLPPGGFSRAGLENVTQVLQRSVDRGEVGGIVGLIFRRGEIAQVDAVGWQDPGRRIPMDRGSIFRIASMTKPITAVATLILIDEGLLELNDPVDRWLPELAHPRVLRDPTAPLDTAVPAARSIRIIDLLTHRSGIATPRTPPGPLRDALTRADANNAAGYDAWMEWIGDLPLAHEPGSTYLYGNSFDVLGILVERVSGMRYPDFLRKRIFDPLGMKDTDFWIPPAKQPRFASLQSLGRVPASWIPSETAIPNYPSAAGGLYSTVDDYLRFARMLLGGGQLGDVRILSAAAVRAMTTDYLTKEQRKGRPFGGSSDFWTGQGFGLGVALKQDPAAFASELGRASVGSFAWPGVFGTWWQADPAEDLILVFMVPGGDAKPARWDFQAAVYEAISRSGTRPD